MPLHKGTGDHSHTKISTLGKQGFHNYGGKWKITIKIAHWKLKHSVLIYQIPDITGMGQG